MVLLGQYEAELFDLKTITRARPVSLKPQIQHLLCKGAWGACTRRLFWRLFLAPQQLYYGFNCFNCFNQFAYSAYSAYFPNASRFHWESYSQQGSSHSIFNKVVIQWSDLGRIKDDQSFYPSSDLKELIVIDRKKNVQRSHILLYEVLLLCFDVSNVHSSKAFLYLGSFYWCTPLRLGDIKLNFHKQVD